MQWKVCSGEFAVDGAVENCRCLEIFGEAGARKVLRHIARIGGGVLSEAPPGDKWTSSDRFGSEFSYAVR